MNRWLIAVALVVAGYWAYLEYGPGGGQGVRLQSGAGGAGVAALKRSSGQVAGSVVGAASSIGN